MAETRGNSLNIAKQKSKYPAVLQIHNRKETPGPCMIASVVAFFCWIFTICEISGHCINVSDTSPEYLGK